MYIAVGRIIQPHGTRGYLKAFPYSQLSERFLNLKSIYIEMDDGTRGFIIEDVQIQISVSLLKLKGIESRETALQFAHRELLVPEEQKIQLPENTYFIHELIGLQVFDIDNHYLGILEEVLPHTGNDVYLVKNKQQEILIPAVSEFVKGVDMQQKRMIVKLIEGMME